MWHYLYFIVLIKVKDPTEFTGPESYVHDMVKVCTGWTVNDVAFLCMISFGTILALIAKICTIKTAMLVFNCLSRPSRFWQYTLKISAKVS